MGGGGPSDAAGSPPEGAGEPPGGVPASGALRDRLSDRTPAQRVIAGTATVLVALALVLHTVATFLTVAPANAVTAGQGDRVRAYMGPEFKQSWQLFSPDITRTMDRVYARRQLRAPDGSVTTTDWTDLTGADLDELRGNLMPSRIRQQLNNAWSTLAGSHDAAQRPLGQRGLDSEQYLKRLALTRTPAPPAGSRVVRLQFRDIVTTVPAPPWQQSQAVPEPTVRTTPWWPVGPADLAEGHRA
ncbi:DUF5819 family protein [Streptomyces sp. LP05-1]|uniref:DUF5819 family protein n=1 Tax=Streptomyces pyxinae TaxID=2970734 RepID=A0ABT2CED4_9ACTN|nr:DUF5819 family protein [Streptomyces sp. LP05-1]MCS0635738.1 DUF5819 family protein [Streptomyces sp. LP05-1]